MITFSLDENSKTPLYEQLYMHIRRFIESGAIKAGEKLPSKRKLAAHLHVSVNTVENAYSQLNAEGYIKSVEKKGYFARQVEYVKTRSTPSKDSSVHTVLINTYAYDMKTNAVDTNNFPFSMWAKLMREVLKDERVSLLIPCHPQGEIELRYEIARYLKNYRNMDVSPHQIVLGAGTEYLLGIITELFDKPIFAIEDPCYHKQPKILKSKGVPFYYIKMDDEGICINSLKESAAFITIITPSRHFPSGAVMSINRRMQLLKWAEEEWRFIIEDDFDSEYRYMLKQIPSLNSLDSNGNVIYMNTFARTLSPSFRVGYMVLPGKLVELYEKKLSFYSCTVSKFDQYTLKKFLQNGCFERHINRMRQIYKHRRDTLIDALSPLTGKIKIKGQAGGLHLLIESVCGVLEDELVKAATQKGVKVYPLSGYYSDNSQETNTVIIGYGGLNADELAEAAKRLVVAWSQ